MKNLLTYLTLLIIAIGCGEFDNNLVEDKAKLESKYCANQIELISAKHGFFPIEKEVLLEQNLIQTLDSIIGKEYCDLRVNMGVQYNLDSKKFNDGPSTIPINLKFNKTCSDMVRGCGYYNYMEVLYNINYQILFEGEYIQMEEIKKRVPEFFAYIDSNYHEEPRKIFMTIQWDTGLELDSLSNLFGYVIDGYFETVSNYSLKRFNASICDLSKTEVDTLKQEFPFNLEIPSIEVVVPPVPHHALPINVLKDSAVFVSFTKSMYTSDGARSEIIGLKSFDFIKAYTKEFAFYFITIPELTQKDLELWASFIYSEIGISQEGKELKAINELEKHLLDNAKEYPKESQLLIKELIIKIKEAHSKSIKN